MKARLTKQVIANELFYRFDRPDWLNSRVCFWKNGGEIDFIVKREKELLPLEMKYQKNAGFQDLRTIQKLGFNLEVDGNRLGDCYDVFVGMMVDYLAELGRDYFFHMDHVYSNPSYFIIVIATTRDKINEARRVFQLTHPAIYRIMLDQLLRNE